ncbi:hypothetical protein A0256_20205 [Mucilaginibacter sp. PAMC 26640]|nr:hypothetical protein A0256_20205 [Mucilaginibacter sp. PAMC 26640]
MAQQTIMIIDDDAEILNVISLLLKDAGYLVKVGHDVTDLFEVEKNPPDLLLIDNFLNGKTGHDICYQLKISPKTNTIPVLLLSGTTNLEQTAKSCMADGFIAKPFEADELISTIENVIGPSVDSPESAV